MTTRILSPGQAEEPPAPGSHEKLDRLRTLLREMFQLDRGDLDFGLYRIMNLKSAEITKFLDQDLLPQVKTSLRLTSAEDREALSERLKSAREQARKLGYNPDAQPSDVIIDLNHRLGEMRKDAAVEADVYNHLANFFGRYYSEGDFISQRRYSTGGRSSYLIPYDGEEVKLHWANADQYYIKTTENYASYAFTVDAEGAARRVRFEITAADNEKDNVKEPDGKQRRFVLAGADAVGVEDGDLVVRFEHRPLTQGEKKAWPGNGGSQQRRINEVTAGRILSAVDSDWQAPLSVAAPTEANGERSLLAKHVERYTAKNTFDYFIHKDLGGFLRRELDLYLNTEVLNLDDVEQGDAARLDRALARVRAIRHIGGKIIDFLAQLEDFQKKLWLKKKFVLETNWCVTLDRVPEEMYPEIAANAAQCEEWIELFAVDEINGDLANGNTSWSNPPSSDFLKANPYLMLDTKHFPRDFTDRLLAALSDAGPLDEQMDGLLIHGENFQALNLLQARYQDRVQCAYIDPPYNTDASSIMYKNGYKDSSWIAMMGDRLALASLMLKNDGIACVAIDDEEVSVLRTILTNNFASELGVVTVRSNPAGRKTKGRFAPAHEYALFYGKTYQASPAPLQKTSAQNRSYPQEDEQGRFMWTNLVRSGTNDRRDDRPRQFYPIFVNADNEIRIPNMEWNEDTSSWTILESNYDDEIVIYPYRRVGGIVVEGNWQRGHHRLVENSEEYRARNLSSGEVVIDFKKRMDQSALPKTWWDSSKYSSANGTMQLSNLLGGKVFDFPKSVSLVKDCLTASIPSDVDEVSVIDYFAGSGTTGHAILDLNRERSKRYRFILIEVADWFDTVLLPRIKKVVYSRDWKEGKPKSVDGSSQVLKYLRLECYEDVIGNLEVASQSIDQKGQLVENPELAEDYRLRYLLGEETVSSASLLGKDFKDPFSYTLPIVHDGLCSEIKVDIPETFNYLIGLHIESRRWLDGVLTITGKNAEGHNCLVLWRNRGEIDYDDLDAWFLKNRTILSEQLDLIYVNGDHTLNAVRQPKETWIAETIEPVFRELMFGAIE